ncbi:MAG: hypothetical protein ACTSRZ_08425 [Promethearchaeota archaeon]
MVRRSIKIGSKLFDYFILIISIVTIVVSLLGFLFLYFYLNISVTKPYILDLIMLVLGIMGIRVWRAENVD